ncbi:MAG: 16S rRNA (cytidine(1402)-2'-O)-methyltransferase [Bacteroidales bacterium]|nr:16S rRNA (cytidine(1402)-2'-O)-methyltransferase [Bacteroidales bacterium]
MSKLYLVPTPIGNLEDITLRAIRILKEVDIILAEDTRLTSRLLKHIQVSTPMKSHHQFNEHKTVSNIIESLKTGTTYALVTDAGTPGISDPGFLLVRECIQNEIEVETLPGPTAFVPALVNSGFPCDRFYFEGFLPVKKGRKARLEFLSQLSVTFILYESPFRLVKTLDNIIEYLGPDRRASVSREISKIHEEHTRGSLLEIKQHFSLKNIKGEIVIVVEGKN